MEIGGITLLLPLIDGRMDGSNLLGGKQKLMALQKDFHAKVAALHGLSKAPARLSGTAKQAGAKTVLQKLRETSDGALLSAAWAVIREAVERDPAPFMLALGIELTTAKKPGRTMAQIFTSKGKGRAKESSNPIGFTTPEKEQTLCSVGFTPKQHVLATPKQPRPPPARPAPPPAARPPEAAYANQPHASQTSRQAPTDTAPAPSLPARPVTESVRVREGEIDAALYDPTTGEFFNRPPPPARHNRAAADSWASAALARCKTSQPHTGRAL